MDNRQKIPVLRINRTVGTQEDSPAREWKDRGKGKGWVTGKSVTLRLKLEAERR